MEDFLRMIPAGRHWRFVATTLTVLTWALYFVADVQQLDLDLENKIGCMILELQNTLIFLIRIGMNISFYIHMNHDLSPGKDVTIGAQVQDYKMLFNFSLAHAGESEINTACHPHPPHDLHHPHHIHQMAKVSVAVEAQRRNGLPFISLLKDPTYGGVSASYAMQVSQG